MKKIVACIIARTQSKRLPNKVIRDIKNVTMIEHIINRVKNITKLDSIYLCTSIDPNDSILLEIAEKNGIKGYAGSREIVINRMLEVAKIENAETLIRITGDNIFCDEIFTEKMIELHIKNEVDYTRTTLLPLGITTEIFSVKGLKEMYNKLDPYQTEYLTYYVFFSVNSLKKLILYPPKIFRKPFYNLTVDKPEDLERTLFIFEKFKDRAKIYLDDIIELSKRVEIPNLKIEQDFQIKFPNNTKKLYKEYLDDLEKEYKNCIIVNLREDFYEKYKIK